MCCNNGVDGDSDENVDFYVSPGLEDVVPMKVVNDGHIFTIS